MKNEAKRYLFFYKDAGQAENVYIEEHKDENSEDYMLRLEFKNFFMYRYLFEIVDMCMKFDENNNPFTLISYIDEFGIIQYTKFNEEIHRIRKNERV
jgi:hypothetical protein